MNTGKVHLVLSCVLLTSVCPDLVRPQASQANSLKNEVIGGTSSFGQFSGSTNVFNQISTRAQDNDDWNPIWEETGMVPEKVPDLPEGRLVLRYPSGISIRPNDTLTPGLMLQFPDMEWDSDPNSLYTLMIVDVDIVRPDQSTSNFIHYMSTNVPGSQVNSGTLNYDYIPPFAFLFTPDQGLVRDEDGRIDVPVENDVCSPQVLERVQNYEDIVSANNLGTPVAGNFFHTRYLAETTDEFLCVFTRCTGAPFPAPIPGVNDMPRCQGSE